MKETDTDHDGRINYEEFKEGGAATFLYLNKTIYNNIFPSPRRREAEHRRQRGRGSGGHALSQAAEQDSGPGLRPD